MNERDFCYWLQGYFELTEGAGLTENQVEIIKDHLGLAMTKVTPNRGGGSGGFGGCLTCSAPQEETQGFGISCSLGTTEHPDEVNFYKLVNAYGGGSRRYCGN